MAILFDQIPATAQLNLTAVEVTKEKFGSGLTVVPQRVALIGFASALLLGDDDVGKPRQVFSAQEVARLYGAGSQIHAMARALFQNSGSVDVVAFPLLPPEGESATLTLPIRGSVEEAGSVSLSIAGQRVFVPLSKGAQVAQKIAETVNAVREVVVEAEATESGVTLRAKWEGASGNDIGVELNRGLEESLPPGLEIDSPGFLSGGTGGGDVRTALENFSEEAIYTVVVHPFADAVNLGHIEAFERVRWHPRVMRGFVAIGARRGTFDEAVTKGISKRTSFVSALVWQQHIPEMQAQVAAAVGGAVARSAASDPALQFHGVPVRGLSVPDSSTHASWEMRDAAVRNGASALTFVAGQVMVDQLVTTYQTTLQGGVAPSVDRYVNTVLTLGAIAHDRKEYFTNVWGRAKLAGDGQVLPPGQRIMTPNTMRAELLARYQLYVAQGWVEDIESYAETLVVERDAGHPNRLNTLDQVILMGNLRVTAMRLAYDYAR